MNRIGTVWRALGRARQTSMLLVAILTGTQTVLLIVFGQPIWLPVVWMVAFLAVLGVKQSAVTRDIDSRLISSRRETVRAQRDLAETLVSISGISDDLQGAMKGLSEAVSETHQRSAERALSRAVAETTVSHPTEAARSKEPNKTDEARPEIEPHNRFYKVPVYRQRSVQSLSFRGIDAKGIHSVPLGQTSRLNFYFNAKPATTLRVVFHGAVTRKDDRLPRFDRVGTSLASDDAYLAFADPTLDAGPELEIGWYLGTRDFDPAISIVQIIERAQREVGATRLLFIGGSGGGHAALRFSAMFPGSGCYVFSPQTIVSKYHQRHVRAFVRTALYDETAPVSRFEEEFGSRQDLVSLYGTGHPRNSVYYFQNSLDPFHVKHHFEPFEKAMRESLRLGRLKPGQYRSALVPSREGHGAPTAEEFNEHLQHAVAGFWPDS